MLKYSYTTFTSKVLPNFASRIKGDIPLEIYGTGNQTRTYCYITDAIVGFCKVILKGILDAEDAKMALRVGADAIIAVSYTHLTLPTNREV